MRLLLRISKLVAIIISFIATVFFMQWALSLFGVPGQHGKEAGAIFGILIAMIVAHALNQR